MDTVPEDNRTQTAGNVAGLPKPYYEHAGIVICLKKQQYFVILRLCVQGADLRRLCTPGGVFAAIATCGGSVRKKAQSIFRPERTMEMFVSADVGCYVSARTTDTLPDTASTQLKVRRFRATLSACADAVKPCLSARSLFAVIPHDSGHVTRKQARRLSGRCRPLVKASLSPQATSPQCARQEYGDARCLQTQRKMSGVGVSTRNGATLYLFVTRTRAKIAALVTDTASLFIWRLTTLSQWRFGPISCLRLVTE